MTWVRASVESRSRMGSGSERVAGRADDGADVLGTGAGATGKTRAASEPTAERRARSSRRCRKKRTRTTSVKAAWVKGLMRVSLGQEEIR
jgi:hypothetical protein